MPNDSSAYRLRHLMWVDLRTHYRWCTIGCFRFATEPAQASRKAVSGFADQLIAPRNGLVSHVAVAKQNAQPKTPRRSDRRMPGRTRYRRVRGKALRSGAQSKSGQRCRATRPVPIARQLRESFAGSAYLSESGCPREGHRVNGRCAHG